MIIPAYFPMNKEQEFEISGLIGPKYQWASQLSIRQIYCSRMVIQKASKDLIAHFPDRTDTIYGSIEIRPGGALVTLSQEKKQTAWVIPFHLLAILKSECWEVHANGMCLKLMDPPWKNKNFISLLMNHKRSALGIEMN